VKHKSILIAILAAFLALAPVPAPAVQARPNSVVTWPTEGWQTTSPEEQGMDSAQLAAFLDGFGTFPHSMLVIRHGYVVLDASTPPFKSSQQHALYAATASFVSTLVGIAIDKGSIKSANQSIWDFLPKDKTANMDANKAAMTIGDLLTHRTGNVSFRDSDDKALYGLTPKDPAGVQIYLDAPLEAKPGTGFSYHEADALVVSAILQKATGMSTLDFAKQNLFGPLGITDMAWMANPQGVTFGGGELYLSPQDMAKLGYLYLHNGQWEGKQIVSEAWVKTSTSNLIGTSGSSEFLGGYGYFWWNGPLGPTGHMGYLAFGLYGQEIWVIPAFDLVAVLTGDVGWVGGDVLRFTNNLLPAVKSETALPANPDALAKLQAKVQALGNPEPKSVQPIPDNRKSVAGRVYTLEENPLQWKSFRLDFGAQDATLTLDAEGRQLKLPVGLDDVYRVSSAGLPLNLAKPFYRLRADSPIASKGNWTTRWFSLDMCDLLGSSSWSIRFKFAGDSNSKATVDASYVLGITGSTSIAGTAQ
jgi:CubicO group peptidase (beta-lactamase class C family)